MELMLRAQKSEVIKKVNNRKKQAVIIFFLLHNCLQAPQVFNIFMQLDHQAALALLKLLASSPLLLPLQR